VTFEPLDWLTTADELRDAGGEASLRAAAGRYYYAVWLKSLLSLESDGILKRRNNRDDHFAVIRALRRKRTAAAEALQVLESLRAAADYRPERTFTAQMAAQAQLAAERVRFFCEADWARLP
jgi:hypothetical protein